MKLNFWPFQVWIAIFGHFELKLSIFGVKWTFLGKNGMFRDFWTQDEDLYHSKLFKKASDTTFCWKSSHLTHKRHQNTPFLVKNAIFGPKFAVLKTFLTWIELFTFQITCSIFRYLLLLKMTPLKFMYCPKTAFFAIFTLLPILVKK